MKRQRRGHTTIPRKMNSIRIALPIASQPHWLFLLFTWIPLSSQQSQKPEGHVANVHPQKRAGYSAAL